MRMVFEVTGKRRDGKRIERPEKLARRKARNGKLYRQTLAENRCC